MGKRTNLSSLPLSSGSSLPLMLGPMSSPHWHSELLPVLSLSEQEASWWPSLAFKWLWRGDPKERPLLSGPPLIIRHKPVSGGKHKAQQGEAARPRRPFWLGVL